jgi:hypothetical protein
VCYRPLIQQVILLFDEGMSKAFENGYYAAIEDVETAMTLAEVTESQPTFGGGIVFNTYNHPQKFVAELKKLRDQRFKRPK